MLFPTTVFAVFFACVFALHWSLPWTGARKLTLLAASLIFYGWWSCPFAAMLLVSAVVNHALARLCHSRGGRGWLVLAVTLNIGLLAFFKYAAFLVNGVCAPLGVTVAGWFGRLDVWIAALERIQPLLDSVVLPVGISFYTFQALSYVIDAARGTIRPAKSVLDFANYLAFFPQLVAGPIVRAADLLPAMETLPERRAVRLDTARAAALILIGLFKKMVLADWLAANLADPVFLAPDEFGVLDTLAGVYAYALQIYCDFSAYSDIAIGCALLLGFEFPLNFNAPYLSGSFKEFWRRWHISLSTWLRDYLYIPLGGSRAGRLKTLRNLVLTMFLGGLWHGAGWAFALWGLFHGAALAVERVLSRATAWRPPAFLARLFVFHAVAFAWILFRAGSAEGLETFCGVCAGLARTSASPELPLVSGVVVMLVAVAAQLGDGGRLAPLLVRARTLPGWAQGGLTAFLLTVILALAPEGVAPFIYFQF